MTDNVEKKYRRKIERLKREDLKKIIILLCKYKNFLKEIVMSDNFDDFSYEHERGYMTLQEYIFLKNFLS